MKQNLVKSKYTEVINTAWKVSKYGVFSGPYFPVFGLNTGNYGLEKPPYVDTFHVHSKQKTEILNCTKIILRVL